ncbi:hypothetical protein [Leifsonia aquatica]|uniref:hypothetical protein n=1 Tax=Leifsonia aquatica TaxID=144185 RepID=UPI0037F8AEEA
MPALDIDAAVALVIDKLGEAGVPAEADARDINPPMAWVTTGNLTIETLAGGGSLVVNIDLIAPNLGETETRPILNGMLHKALTVISPDGPIETDRALPLRDGSMLPAYRIPVAVEL